MSLAHVGSSSVSAGRKQQCSSRRCPASIAVFHGIQGAGQVEFVLLDQEPVLRPQGPHIPTMDLRRASCIREISGLLIWDGTFAPGVSSWILPG